MKSRDIALDGRTILITGSGGGLGRAMALGLLARGANVVITDLSDRVLEAVRATATPAERVLVLPADITIAADREKLLDSAIARFGKVDVLVNNAGVSTQLARTDFLTNPVRFWEHDENVLRKLFEVNTVAPQMLSSMALPLMLEQGFGRIVNVTSSLPTMLGLGMSGYGGSKAALEAISAVMAAELRGTGVTVNVLIPGGMADTSMVPRGSDIDRSRLINPARMIPPVVWLASDNSAGVTARRFIAVRWNDDLPLELAVEQAGAPIAWSGLGTGMASPMSDANVGTLSV